MGKKGKKAQAGKPKKLTPKDIGKRLDALAKKLEEELKGADLFAPMPPTEDCPLCLVPLPRIQNKTSYRACCGNTICKACVAKNSAIIDAKNEQNAGKKDRPVIRESCPFCRAPAPSSIGEAMRQCEERKAPNDYQWYSALGHVFIQGKHGLAEDKMKALDYFIRAAELGSPETSADIAKFYREGGLISQDMERFALFIKVAALRGSISGRHDVGILEYNAGNHELGTQHWEIAAEAGSQVSLNQLRDIYNANGKMPGKEFISKDDLDNLYRACHEDQMEINSEERKKHWDSPDDWKC